MYLFIYIRQDVDNKRQIYKYVRLDVYKSMPSSLNGRGVHGLKPKRGKILPASLLQMTDFKIHLFGSFDTFYKRTRRRRLGLVSVGSS
jgi:hypothetical protein